MSEQYFLTWGKQNRKLEYTVEDAEGVYIYINGKKCFDMSSQAINVNIGHKNQRIINAIKEQCDRLSFVGASFGNSLKSNAAKEILSVSPKNMAKVYFTSSGAEANENAIKIARAYTNKTKIFSAYNSYHGSYLGAGSLTGDARRFGSEKSIAGFIKFDFPDMYHCVYKYSSEKELTEIYLHNLEQQIINENPNDIAAIFIEPIIGGNGVIIPPKGYLEGIRALCNKYNILMVCDEVMTGWGRTGEWFCVDSYKIQPDMITTSKGITSSYIAFGAVIVSAAIAEFFLENNFACGSTNYGHLLGCVATIANIQEYKDKKIIQNSKILGEELKDLLNKLKDKYSIIGDVRCKGLFACIEFVKDRLTKEPYTEISKIIPQLVENGFWTLSRKNIVMIAPPLIITSKQLNDAMLIFDNVLNNFINK